MEQNGMGNFLAALRRANGYTQETVAEYLGVSNRTVSSWECGKSAPDLSLLPLIADLYGVTCDEILRGARSAQGARGAPESSDARVRAIVLRAAKRLDLVLIVAAAVLAAGLFALYLAGYALFNSVAGFVLALFFGAASLVTAFVWEHGIAERIDSEEFEDARAPYAAARRRKGRLYGYLLLQYLALCLPMGVHLSAHSVLAFSSYAEFVLLAEAALHGVLGIVFLVIRCRGKDARARAYRRACLRTALISAGVIAVTVGVCIAVLQLLARGREKDVYDSRAQFCAVLLTPCAEGFFREYETHPERYRGEEVVNADGVGVYTFTYTEEGGELSASRSYFAETMTVDGQTFAYYWVNDDIVEVGVDGAGRLWTVSRAQRERNAKRNPSVPILCVSVLGIAGCLATAAVEFCRAERKKDA